MFVKFLITLLFTTVPLFSTLPPPETPSTDSWFELQSIPKRCGFLAIAAGTAGLARCLKVAGEVSQFFTSNRSVKNECGLLGHLCQCIARQAFYQALHQTAPLSSYDSWENNRTLLSQIAPFSQEDAKLLRFLQERWLAKVASFSSLAIHWAYPCFGIYPAVHPGTNHSYARLLTSQCCSAYIERAEAWKKSLGLNAPLILTRAAELADYLPSYSKVLNLEELPAILQKVGAQEVTLDISPLLPTHSLRAIQDFLAQTCLQAQVNPNQITCVQRLVQESIGGLCLLPIHGQNPETLPMQHHRLLDWLSGCGLAANRVELDRWPVQEIIPASAEVVSYSAELASLLRTLAELEENPSWQTAPSHKQIMLGGTLLVLRGLLQGIPSQSVHTKGFVVHLALSRIGVALHWIAQAPQLPFPEFCAQLETVHADLSALLEIFLPYKTEDFASIYRELLYKNPSMPAPLKNFTTCGLHTSGMTNLAAVVKAIEKTIGKRPLVLYGENTYFECVGALTKRSEARSIHLSSDTDWAQADLLVEQFNPVLQLRFDIEYRVENVVHNVRRCLKAKQGAPLTLALDCTIDYLQSSHLAHLLQEFRAEIEEGLLNIVGFRSGNKFDLFGIDNYCGGPFFVIHNRDAKWDAFQSLWDDACLQADPLSLNWFCLAYSQVPHILDAYRNQIFTNTRALLDRVPKALLTAQSGYRVSPASADATLAFVDIKIAGPFHAYRGPALVAGLFYLKSIEAGRPLFNRPSLGFYHSNCTMQFGQTHSTIRLTLGLDPMEVDIYAKCLETISEL